HKTALANLLPNRLHNGCRVPRDSTAAHPRTPLGKRPAIVGSTQRLAELGDARWADLPARPDGLPRREIERHRGPYIDSAKDGLLATFDGPARAVRCAQSLTAAVGELGLNIRAGCHAGKIELAGDHIRGLAVHTGARVGALTRAGEVLVSSTV